MFTDRAAPRLSGDGCRRARRDVFIGCKRVSPGPDRLKDGMSKIFDAYRKRAGASVDLTQEIGRAGAVSLFPAPVERQQADFNQLANRVLSLRSESRGAVICFAATASGEGASYVSYNAAMALAQTYRQDVVWIDGNFLSPQAKLLDRNQPTFSTMLQDPEQVDNLVVDGNPLLLGAGPNLTGSKGLLAGVKYVEMLGRLTRRFDFVIMDLPPVLETRDSALMAAGGDGMLLVIEQKYLKREIVEHGLRILQDKGVQVLGSVINRREYLLPKIIYDRL